MVINGTTAVHLTDNLLGKSPESDSALHGWLTSQAYHDSIERSIVIAPLQVSEGPCCQPLGPEGKVLYSSLDNINDTELAPVFDKIESHLKIRLVYGFQNISNPVTRTSFQIETLLLDVKHMSRSVVNTFKRELYDDFGIQSHRFEHLWQYERSVRLAPAAVAVLETLNATDDMTTVISHDYSGVPTLLCMLIRPFCHATTVFYAHEVSTIRNIIEAHPGHDTMYYNVMNQATLRNLHIDDVFGEPCHTFQHVLTTAASHCHRILAVGDRVASEMRFLGHGLETKNIDVVHEGLSLEAIDLATRREAKTKLQTYCNTLLGYTPDWIFSHVAKHIKREGLWRDLRVLSAMDREFQESGRTGVMFMVCTDNTSRPTRDILQMEANYGWPVAHREGLPDLVGEEVPFFDAVQTFNARARNIKVLFINQSEFNSDRCGRCMPKDMSQMDLRQGTDVEFCLSVYESSGVSHLEPMAYGGLCVVNRELGCLGINGSIDQSTVENLLLADFTDIEFNHPSIEDALRIGQSRRDQVEQGVCRDLARQILNKLPVNEDQAQALLGTGAHLTAQMHWDIIIRNFLHPVLQSNLICTNT